MTKDNLEVHNIEDGLFFMDDFKRLPKDTIVFIKKGKIMRGRTEVIKK